MAIMNDLADAPAAPPSVGTAAPKAGGSFARYLVTRFLLIFPTIFILVTLVFFLMRVTGDPITAALGGRLTPDQLAERIHAAGYDRPVIVQYFEYLGQVFTGNFGRTISDNRAVTEVLATYGAATLELAFNALVIALLVGIPFGLLAARLRDHWPDAVLRVFAILCYATPVFFAGLLLKLAFGVWLGWLPIAGRAGVNAELQLTSLQNPTGIYLLDALRTRKHGRGLDVAAARGAPGPRTGPAHRRRVPAPGAHQRHRHPGPRATWRPAARGVSEYPAAHQARLPPGADPDHHRDGPADRAAARRRGADRDHLRVEGPRLQAGPVPHRTRLRGRAGHRGAAGGHRGIHQLHRGHHRRARSTRE